MEYTLEISLVDLLFNARHGVLPQETVVGNEFSVDVSLKMHYSSSSEDDIDGTVSYADVYNIVKEEMEVPRKLLETVAVAISNRILTRWQDVGSGRVRITKLNPPIPGITGSASVTIHF